MTVSSKAKQTLATLKGIESTLKIYSLQTQVGDTKSVFENALKKQTLLSTI